MKKIIFGILMLLVSLKTVCAIDNVRITLSIDEENHIMKQIVVDNKDEEFTMFLPESGKIPGSFYGYYVDLKDINSNVKYKKNKNSLFFSNISNQGRIVINNEYDVSFRQYDGYEYFTILEGIDKDIDTLSIQLIFEETYDVNDLKMFINNKETKKYTRFISGNKASITLNKLNSNDFVSFQVKRSVKHSISILTIISFVFPILCLILSFVLWYLYGKDRIHDISKKMNPVRELSLLEVAKLYNEKVTKKDVISLIFSLCSKGFVKIVETKDELKLVRLKNYNGHSYSEGLLFDSLFVKSYVGTFDEVINKKKKEYNDEVNVKDIRIIRTINRIISNENMNNKKYEFFERDTSSKKNIIIGMAIICLVLVTINPFITINNSWYFVVALIIEIISFYLIYRFVEYVDFNKVKKYLVPILLTVLFFVLIFAFVLGTNSVYEVAYLLGIVCVVGMMIFAKYMPKRNVYGDKLFGKMEGFRKLLEEGTKEELENVLKTNSNYYYDMLVYMYILGNKDNVCKRFKNLVDKKCEWYESYKKYDYNNFNKSCDVIMDVVRENN